MAKQQKTVIDKEYEILESLFDGFDGKVSIAGEDITFRPWNMKQTKVVLQKAGVLIATYANHGGFENLPTPVIIGLIQDSVDEVMEVVAMTIKKDKEFVEELDPYTFIEILLEIIRVNRSFFDVRVGVIEEKAKALMPDPTTPSED